MTSHIKTIDINFLISGTKIIIPFSAICSITNKAFERNVVIEYCPNKKVVEYVNTEKVIEKITKGKLNVEELADRVFKTVKTSIFSKVFKNFS